MKRSVCFLICNIVASTGSLNFLAWSLAPISNTCKKSNAHRFPAGAVTKNAISRRSREFLHILSSSPTEGVDSTSSDEIIGPELPPLQASSKRLFLVRHGEVINPGKKRQGLCIIFWGNFILDAKKVLSEIPSRTVLIASHHILCITLLSSRFRWRSPCILWCVGRLSISSWRSRSQGCGIVPSTV